MPSAWLTLPPSLSPPLSLSRLTTLFLLLPRPLTLTSSLTTLSLNASLSLISSNLRPSLASQLSFFDKSILITNNSASHFTLDGSRLTHPDIYTNAAITVHGIDNLLDHSVYGTESGKNSSKPDAVGPPPTPASPPRPTPRTFVPSTADDEEFTVHQHGESDAACLCTEL
ncbi:hypothetical protein H0E87_000059 [Populus deltoides]|uniref:FAS1 domain-containing protein n=1 Tax=Populus deltoides TaxID=3696 RepID=A0A8T2ZL99_POPDE|nr:hypothetical protein H0E87_000059 [Populus deltoides]